MNALEQLGFKRQPDDKDRFRKTFSEKNGWWHEICIFGHGDSCVVSSQLRSGPFEYSSQPLTGKQIKAIAKVIETEY